jgi:hypothetical protein
MLSTFITHDNQEMQWIWDKVPSKTRKGFLLKFSQVVAKTSKVYESGLHADDFMQKYCNVMGVYDWYFYWNDLLCMYRVAHRSSGPIFFLKHNFQYYIELDSVVAFH